MMPVLVLLVILLVLGAWWVLRGPGDVPTRMVARATGWLPAYRREWGRAMVAELASVHGRAPRWRFAAGVVRVVALPPPRRPGRVAVIAPAALTHAALATAITMRTLPGLAVFVAALGVLLAGLAGAAAWRSPRAPRTPAHRAVAALALAGLAGTVVAVVRIGAAHPSATRDSTHVFSVLLALALAGCLAVALTRPRPTDDHPAAVPWWALGGALAGTAGWLAGAVLAPGDPAGVLAMLPLIGLGAVVLAATGAAATTGSARGGARAGLLAVVLAAPVHVAIDLTSWTRPHTFTLSTAYDIAAYPRSGYPDVASYVLSDAVAGEIVAGLVAFPLVAYALAAFAATVTARLRH